MRKAVGMVCLLVLALLPGCAGDGATSTANQPSPANPTVGPETPATPGTQTFMDPDQEIQVMLGDEFMIKIPGNATTGYVWENNPPFDAERLQLVNSDYVSFNSGAVGSPGVYHWVFMAKQRGPTRITFIEHRPWEKDVPPANTRVYKVLVQ